MPIDKLSGNSFSTGAIANSLGYTPANKAGDTFTGAVVVSNTISVGNTTITGTANISGNSFVAGIGTFGTTTTGFPSPLYAYKSVSNITSGAQEANSAAVFGKADASGDVSVFIGADQGTNKYGYVGSVNKNTSYTPLILQPAGGNVGIGANSMPIVSLDMGTKTDAIRLPVGNTAQRPTGNTGLLRYNTDVQAPEFYSGGQSAWVSLGALDGSSYAAAAPSATFIKNLGISASGVYWIKTPNMATPVQVYCDLSYDSGGYMLLAYGYVSSTGDDSANKAIPNLNHDGTAWAYAPTNRASTNGLVLSPSSQKSALLIAKSSTYMIMAAGSNPTTGGIDSYTYVYKFGIPSPSSLTFNNHSYYYNGSMTNSSGLTVTGLKGDTGTWTRYTIVEAIGASWGDSYPSGYGCIESSTPKNANWNYGPFFPSIHSGSRNIAPSNPTVVTSSPDIGVNGYTAGAQSYTYRGWYGAGIGHSQTGQTSIWVK